MTILSGLSIGGYHILEQLGEGSMATVRRWRQASLRHSSDMRC